MVVGFAEYCFEFRFRRSVIARAMSGVGCLIVFLKRIALLLLKKEDC
jgi:hypothetical protein